MLIVSLWLVSLLALSVSAQSDSAESGAATSGSDTGSATIGSAISATGSSIGALRTLTGDELDRLTRVTGDGISYPSFTSQITVDPSTSADSSNSSKTTSAFSAESSGSDFSATQVTRSSRSRSLTIIGADPTSTSGIDSASVSASATSSAVLPENTLPCNGYPEFCNRQYSNITEVCAHNSAFSVPNNLASNQELDIVQQLDDGIRMIQGETRLVNDTIYMCHSSCDLLNAGRWQDELETIVDWLEANPYDVVTILIGNGMYVKPHNYVSAIENSGIRPYLYEPEYIPQHRDQWPTLGEMIISGKRVVMFMDYEANQRKIPYILNEFTHIWETPFSPTNQSFPCTIQRPPNLGDEEAKDKFMYIANHNLNTAIGIGSFGFGPAEADGGVLIPSKSKLNITNAAGYEHGMLGTMKRDCTGKSPFFLNP